MSLRVLFVLHRIGPYHRARLVAAAEAGLELTVLQTRPRSQEYPWSFDPVGPYTLANLSGAANPEADPPVSLLDRQLSALLDRSQPAAIVSVGWADRAYQRLLLLAQRRLIPVVIVSDSRQRDEPRTAAKEWIKRQLLRGYSAALVAGTESRAYLEDLGFPAAAIFQPWDVVDNIFFENSVPASGVISRPHFLCLARFIREKNLVLFLQAYAIYCRQGGCWELRLVGSGPLDEEVRAAIESLPNPAAVHLRPFVQQNKVACLLGEASAFVLPSIKDTWGLVVNEAMAAGLPCLVSTACGCAVDLIEHGVTGWCFDPGHPDQLAALMHCAEQQPPAERAAMVTAARQRLDQFSPQTFAEGLQQAVQHAIAQPRHSYRAALLARALSHQP